jgi:glycosidase
MAWTRSTKIQVGLLAGSVVFWGGILGWTLTVDEGDIDPPDHLDDPAFGRAAEPICADAVATLEERDLLHPSPESPEDRADIVDASNAVLAAMVLDLRGLPRPAGEEGEWVGLWLSDWDQHLADRQNWADGLREGHDGPFTETARAGNQISKVIDNFADVNDMPSCTTTHDV